MSNAAKNAAATAAKVAKAAAETGPAARAIFATVNKEYMSIDPTTLKLKIAQPLPVVPPPSETPRLFRKRPRMYDHWKLRPVRKWADFAPFTKKIVISYDPAVEGTTGARLVTFLQAFCFSRIYSFQHPFMYAFSFFVRFLCRELARQASGQRIRQLFSKYEIEHNVLDNGIDAQVRVEWNNGKQASVNAQWLTMEEILDCFENERYLQQIVEEDKEML